MKAALLAFCLPTLALAQAPTNPIAGTGTVVLKAARVIDGTGAAPIQNGAVVITDDKIVAVGPAATVRVPAGARTVDLGNATLMPGFIDAHTHVIGRTLGDPAGDDANVRDVDSFGAILSTVNVRNTLMAGFTSIRNVGSPRFDDIAIRKAINEGWVVGPRMQTGAHSLGITGGHCDENGFKPGLADGDFKTGIADGPDQIRAAVRRVIKDGADVVKCYVGGDALLPHTPIADCTYTLDEVKALVDETRMRGRLAAAHVRGQRSSEVAARAGVDSIEHATYADDATLRLIRDQGLFLVPGLRYLYSIIENGPRFGITEEIIGPSGLRDEIKQAADTYQRARDLGIRMCPGGDFGFAWCPHGEYAKDIQVFVDVIGFSPLEAIRAATSWGAELMRMQDRIGTLERGKLADLVVVDGDPLRDISVLQDRQRLSVMKGGRFVTQHLS
jgi:imidazolonepropionase-like amidohydrolase